MTEFIGYVSLGDLKASGAFMHQKSIIMATYALSGFANVASIGIQLGGIGSLAPGKRVLLSQLGFRALVAGALASLLSATIIGMILNVLNTTAYSTECADKKKDRSGHPAGLLYFMILIS